MREYLVNGTPPFRKLRVREWFIKFGQKLELMCFKNSVHLGAEKYLHCVTCGTPVPNIFAVQGNGKKKLFGKDLVVLSIRHVGFFPESIFWNSLSGKIFRRVGVFRMS